MKIKILTVISIIYTIVTAHAAVNIDNYISGNTINNVQFTQAANAAVNNGNEIVFSARNYIVTQDLIIDQPWLRLRGAGKNTTTLTWGGATLGWTMFTVRVNGVRFDGMKLTGNAFPTYNNDPYSIVGSSVKTGLRFAIRLRYRWIRDLKVYGCKMEKVDVGVGAIQGTRYSGLRCGWNDFQTGRGSVWVLSDRNGGNEEREGFASMMIIRNNRLTYHPGQATQGIALDYGVVPAVGEVDTVDLKSSRIHDNDCDRIIFWQVGVTRISNLNVFNNIFRGGGQGPKASYVHCIHIEEGITGMNVYNNTMTQWRNNTNGQPMTSISIITSTAPAGTIWPKVNFYNNTCTGNVDAAILGGLKGWSITNNAINMAYNGNWVSGWKFPSTATVSGNTRFGSNIDSQIYLNN